ncbi:ABC transporter ATP-binding protein [Acuticoccus sediminis]|nr:oligopeptide/dipeptide ABC transporter ATP-binding protein [Acuticoccus sediminis]
MMAPSLERSTAAATTGEAPLVSVDGLVKHFPIHGGLLGRTKGTVQAVNDVSFDLARGETLSLVGESGCGKSTVGKCLLGLTPLTAGEIRLDGVRIDTLAGRALKPMRRRMSTVFQDPFSSLNPRMRVKEIVAEPIRAHGLARTAAAREARVGDLLERVGLSRAAMGRMPHQFSGGQRQRIGIARALASEPDVIVCDEAVSALDVSVQAQIINLMMDLQAELGLSLLFISHDLAVVEHMTHRVAVMYLGRIVEVAPRRAIFAGPKHPYTEALLSAVPMVEPEKRRERIVLSGDVPSPIAPPSGCVFRTRCPHAFDRCAAEVPPLRPVGAGHHAACHLNETA